MAAGFALWGRQGALLVSVLLVINEDDFYFLIGGLCTGQAERTCLVFQFIITSIGYHYC